MKCGYHTIGVIYDTVKVAITPNKLWQTLYSVIFYTTFYFGIVIGLLQFVGDSLVAQFNSLLTLSLNLDLPLSPTDMMTYIRGGGR